MSKSKRTFIAALTVIVIIVVIAGIVFVRSAFTAPGLLGNTSRLRMAGNSMAPNFSDGQTILAEPVDTVSSLQRGDVIIFTKDGATMLKRLIALPGETIEIRQGSILIDGKAYAEPYKVIPASYEQEPLKLGADEYYVLGDNRNESSDSHNFGPITGKMISKRVVPQN